MIPANVGKLEIVTNAGKSDADTENDKALREKTVRKWLSSHPDAVVVVFAPWCKHCHNMLPVLGEAARKHASIPAILVDYEALPKSAWSGDGAIHACEYFPTVLVKTKKTTEPTPARSPEEAFLAVSGAIQELADSNKQAPPPASGAAGTDALFARLF